MRNRKFATVMSQGALILLLAILIGTCAFGQQPRYITLKRSYGPAVIPSEEIIRYEVVRFEYDSVPPQSLQLPAFERQHLPAWNGIVVPEIKIDSMDVSPSNVLVYGPNSNKWKRVGGYDSIDYSNSGRGIRVVGGTYPNIVNFDAVGISRTPPDNEPDFAWNNAPYFRTYDYIKQPDTKFFNWKHYNATWDGKQAAVWGLFALSGVAHGIREAYHADPYIFERRNGVEPTSFWGSDSWKRNYYHNDPEGHHKREWAGNVGRDVWHTFNQVDLIPLGTACITMGARKHPIKYKVANTLVGLGLRVLFANITYSTLRYTR